MNVNVRFAIAGVAAAVGVLNVQPPGSSAVAAVKTGQRCTKVGQVRNGLVCTRQGARLVFARPSTTTVTAPPTTARAAAPTTTAAVRSGGQLVYATGEVPSLDPVRFGEGGSGGDRGSAIFDTLLRLDRKGQPQPQLAQSMTSSDQGKTWVLKLRPGVRFTDGTPLNADAVIFNVRRQIDPASRFGFAGTVNDITNMRAVDDLTVEFTLRQPDGSLPIAFTTLPGMIGSPTAIRANPAGFGSRPVGAGPFMLKEWVRDHHLDLVRNPDYWDRGKPGVDAISVKMIADFNSRAQALTSGNADIIYSPVDAAIGLQKVKGIVFFGGIDSGGSAIVANVNRKPVDDVRIREAIALAFNPSDVNQALFGGLWKDERIVCPPFNPNFDECETGLWPAYNPTRAKQLVDLYEAEGNSTDMTLLCNAASSDPEFIQQQLAKIGINVKLNCVSAPVTDVNAGNFTIAWSAMTSFATPYPKVYTYFHSESRNLPKLKDPALDSILDRARRTYNPTERVNAYREFQRANAKNFFYIWYGPHYSGFAAKDNLLMGNQEVGTTIRLGELSFKK